MQLIVPESDSKADVRTDVFALNFPATSSENIEFTAGVVLMPTLHVPFTYTIGVGVLLPYTPIKSTEPVSCIKTIGVPPVPFWSHICNGAVGVAVPIPKYPPVIHSLPNTCNFCCGFLRPIPTLSLVLNNVDLFDGTIGKSAGLIVPSFIKRTILEPMYWSSILPVAESTDTKLVGKFVYVAVPDIITVILLLTTSESTSSTLL